MKKNKPTIGFCGQGWIGGTYSQNFEDRGYSVVRHSLELDNKEKLAECDIVFLALPTPTTEKGFNYDILREVIKLVGKGKIAVIKSTVTPEVPEVLQKENPDIIVMHSPEFLTESTCKSDAKFPDRNIVGIVNMSDENYAKAEMVMGTLPFAPYKLICNAKEASLIKYGGNCWFYFKVLFMNLFYDLADSYDDKYEISFNSIKEALAADPRIGRTHLDPVHKNGRGAGGHCFIKDFQAFSELYHDRLEDFTGDIVLSSLIKRNNEYLIKTNKDIDILTSVYGEEVIKNNK